MTVCPSSIDHVYLYVKPVYYENGQCIQYMFALEGLIKEWLKQKMKKKSMCTGCPKSAVVRGCKLNLFKQISYGYPQPKGGKGQEISGMGRLKNFWVKGKTP